MDEKLEVGNLSSESLEDFEETPLTFEVGKDEWYHVGFHLTATVAGPALLTLPYAMSLLTWYPGIVILLMFYASFLYCGSLVASLHEWNGKRHVHYAGLVKSIFGSELSFNVTILQLSYLIGTNISVFVQSGLSLQAIHQMYYPGNTSIKLYHWIELTLILVLILSQVPSIHSLRYLNGVSMVCTYAYTFGSIGVSIYQATRYRTCQLNEKPPGCIPDRNYGLDNEGLAEKLWEGLRGMAIIMFVYGNTVIPEIQSTAKRPSVPIMYKALGVLFVLLALTYIPISVIGYWAYGYGMNEYSISNLPSYMASIGGPRGAIIAINLITVISSVAGVQMCNAPVLEGFETWVYENIEGEGYWSFRRWFLRSMGRLFYNAMLALAAAAFPFLGDIIAILGALAITPVDLIIPILMHLETRKHSWTSLVFHKILVVAFGTVGTLGFIASTYAIGQNYNTYKLFANLGLLQ